MYIYHLSKHFSSTGNYFYRCYQNAIKTKKPNTLELKQMPINFRSFDKFHFGIPRI